MSKKNQTRLAPDQRGVGSLMFTLVMMIVLSLIVLAFAQVARRGQRESLDNQLSTQAYYAAESGINDAVHAINNGGSWNIADKTTCNNFNTHNPGTNSTINSAANVNYTCLLVDEGPQTSLTYSNITERQSDVIPINPVGGLLTGVQISWVSTSASADVTKCANAGDLSLPPHTATDYTCPFSMLRLDMLPTPTGPFNRAAIQTASMTTFIKPQNTSSPSATNFSATAPRLIPATCLIATKVCTASITGLSSVSYLMHLSSLYGTPGSVTITPLGTGGISLGNAQAIIDVTGKAQDVLRRVQVRVPISDRTSTVSGAIESNQTICKRVTAGNSVSYNNHCND